MGNLTCEESFTHSPLPKLVQVWSSLRVLSILWFTKTSESDSEETVIPAFLALAHSWVTGIQKGGPAMSQACGFG